MSKAGFDQPQRQSVTGIVLIFATSLFHLIRNFWAVGVYLLVMDTNPRTLFFAGLGLVVVLVGTLGYSVLYYLKFLFYVDEEKSSFILQKGVFNSDVVNIPFSKIQQVNFRRNILQRVIGVYSVVIDTAGSNDKEVEIKALSKEKADILADLLMDLSAQERMEGSQSLSEDQEKEVSATPSVEWEYKLDFWTLLKLGLTSNYLRGVSILLAFYITVRSQLNYSEEFELGIPYSAVMEMVSTLVLLLILLVVGMIITVADTFIKYYGLHLVKSRGGLQVEMGLRNNTKVNLKSRRVQLMQETTNPVQRRLDLYKLKISLASSRDDLKKDQIKVPGLTSEVVGKVKGYFYGEEITERQQILPHKILLLRRISQSLLPILIGLIFILFFPMDVSWAIIGGIAAVLVILISVYQYFYFKTIRLSVSEEFLVKHSGIWSKKKEFVEMFKLQSISVSQPIWYKKRGLVNFTFHSAGGDISYPLVQKKEIVPLMNYLMYKIESTTKPWM